MDQYKPFIGRILNLIELLPDNTLFVMDEPTRIRDAARSRYLDISENLASLLELGRILPQTQELFQDWQKIWSAAQRFKILYLSVLGKRVPGMDNIPATSLGMRMPEHVGGSLERFLHRVKQLRRDSYRILVVTNHTERAERLVELLRDDEIPAVYSADVDGNLQMGACLVTTGNLETGFEFPAFKLYRSGALWQEKGETS